MTNNMKSNKNMKKDISRSGTSKIKNNKTITKSQNNNTKNNNFKISNIKNIKINNILSSLKPLFTTTNILYTILGVCILIIIYLQIKTPFLTHNTNEINNAINDLENAKLESKEAENEIADIEEESIRNVMNEQGGMDEVNASNVDYLTPEISKIMNPLNDPTKLSRPQLVLQDSILNDIRNTERFENKDTRRTVLRLFYTPGCPHSEKFMTLWNEIKQSLPDNVDFEELNCNKVDNMGFSICRPYGINKVPSLQLSIPSYTDFDKVDTITYNGGRDLINIKQWLNSKGVKLSYNPEIEHYSANHRNIEGFYNDKEDPYDFGLQGAVLPSEGNIRKPYNDAYKNASKVNQWNEFDDVDEDGCPIANFTVCGEGTKNQGYQVFTSRGQWGCVYPDKNTSLNTDFDAAFAAVDQYLTTLPPKQSVETDSNGNVNVKVEEYNANEKIQKMKQCAMKYRDEIRNFGLCDNYKLVDKYSIPEKLESGDVKLPRGVSASDYEDTKNVAESIYASCSL